MLENLRPISRAILSVSDKTGLVEFAQRLDGFGVELISTGGTARTLAGAGLKVRDVSDLTGFPEMMDGRVKTLHPKIHGGLLAVRHNAEHVRTMQGHHIPAIDLVVVNLYPFETTVAKGASFEDCIENIDIGGPAMIRSAAKNHVDVAVIVEPDDYAVLIAELSAHKGMTSHALRRRLAARPTPGLPRMMPPSPIGLRANFGTTHRIFVLSEAALSNRFATAKIRIRRQRSIVRRTAARALPVPGRFRASSSPITTSTIPMRPTNASRNSTPPAPPPA